MFERRRDQLRDAGAIADPRDAQIDRLKQQVHQLKQRLSAKEQQYTELTAFRIQALGTVSRSVFLARHAGLRSGGMGTVSDDIWGCDST